MNDIDKAQHQLSVRMLQLIIGVLAVFGLLWGVTGRDSFYLKAGTFIALCLGGVWLLSALSTASIKFLVRRRARMTETYFAWSDEDLLAILTDTSERDFLRKQAAIQAAVPRLANNAEFFKAIDLLRQDQDICIRGTATKALNEFEANLKS